jgi:ribosomal protein L11 methyltransferase
MNGFYGVVSVVGLELNLEQELTQLSFDEFGCTGVQNTSSTFGDLETLDLPDNLKTMSGGVDENDGDIINDKVFSSEKVNLEFYFEGKVETLKKNMGLFVKFIESNKLALDVVEKMERNSEWRDSYKEFFSSIKVGDDLEIIPSWEADSSNKSNSIVIEPGLGFGTGSHETTFLCLSFLKKNDQRRKSILDLGCGSGILGIYTEKFKECHCDYVDVDPDALENCRLNLKLNDIDEKNNLFLRDDFVPKKYDLVIANILLPILIEERDVIINAKAENGLIIFSGILKDQVASLKEAYLKTGKIEKVIHFEEKNNWCCLVMK